MRWLQRLKEPEHENDRWCEILETIGDRLFEDESGVYLNFPELDDIDNARHVDEYISENLNKVNRALRIVTTDKDVIETSGLIELKEDGDKRYHLIAESVSYKMSISNVVLESGNRKERIERRRIFVDMVLSDKRVADILELQEQKLTPPTIHNILEGIENDVGGFKRAEELKLGKAKQLQNVMRCLQHRKTSGLGARHIFKDNQAPKEPLTLDEMRRITEDFVQNWIAYKEKQFRENQG